MSAATSMFEMILGGWRSVRLLLLLLVMMLAKIPTLEALTCRGDGCVIPYTMSFPYVEKFRSVCNKLQTCYHCGSGRGVSRKECDDQFLVDMFRSCSWFDLKCKRYTTVRYVTVRLIAPQFWVASPPDWCHDEWVSDCLPPLKATPSPDNSPSAGGE